MLAAALCVAAAAPPTERGLASWYGAYHEGRRTASGCPFRAHRLTAASRTLPLGSWVLVRGVQTGRSVLVQINDRGPYVRGRVIDLSEAAARALGAHDRGVIAVVVSFQRDGDVVCH